MRTFRQFLAEKRLGEVNTVDPTTFRTTVSALAGGPPGATATNLTQIARAAFQKDRPFAVAMADLPEVEKAKSIADAAKKKLQPNQPNPVLPTNMAGPAGATNI